MKTRFGMILILLVAAFVAGGCRTVSPAIVSGAAVCDRYPEICARLCAECPKGTRCVGGECVGDAMAVGSYLDDGDVNKDVFTPGCHWSHVGVDCPDPRTFLKGDFCTSEVEIAEWTETPCHSPGGDLETFDCRKECKAIGQPGGRCVPLEGACDGKGSARCECDIVTP